MTGTRTDDAPWALVLVRYGEIGIKSQRVRRRFEDRLVGNIESALARRHVEGRVTREWGRFFVHARDVDAAVDALTHTLGVVSVSRVQPLPPTLDAIKAAVVDIARDAVPSGSTFAVRVRRTGTHPFTSVEAARDAGAAVFAAFPDRNLKVDLADPDVEIHVEVRETQAYTYRDVESGPGGLPVGTQGRVGALIEDARGALAAWFLMKRGCTLAAVIPDDRDVTHLIEALRDWAPRLRGVRVPVPRDVADDPARRRAFLLKATGDHVRSRRGHAVVLGDGLAGAVASAHLDAAAGLPVFRPLTGYRGDALAGVARRAEIPAEDEPAELPRLADADADVDAVRAALRASSELEEVAAR